MAPREKLTDGRPPWFDQPGGFEEPGWVDDTIFPTELPTPKPASPEDAAREQAMDAAIDRGWAEIERLLAERRNQDPLRDPPIFERAPAQMVLADGALEQAYSSDVRLVCAQCGATIARHEIYTTPRQSAKTRAHVFHPVCQDCRPLRLPE